MVKKAKIGFIGCGGHATGSLYPTIHTIPEIDLVAVCDLKEELAKRNARNFGARRWYTDLEKMLSNEELEGAIVVGPPRMHCEIGKRCLGAGLPIFVEKPSAISSKEAFDLAEYAKEKNLFGAVAFMKSIFGYAVALIFKNGAVGLLNINALQGPGFQMSEYFVASGYECWLEVKDMVSLNYYSRVKPMPEFNPDGRAQVFSWKPEFTEFLASKAEGLVGYKGELQNFARKILGKEELRANLFDGAKALEIGEAIWESSQNKKPVKMKYDK